MYKMAFDQMECSHRRALNLTADRTRLDNTETSMSDCASSREDTEEHYNLDEHCESVGERDLTQEIFEEIPLFSLPLISAVDRGFQAYSSNPLSFDALASKTPSNNGTH